MDKILQLKEFAMNKTGTFCSEHVLGNLSMILELSTYHGMTVFHWKKKRWDKSSGIGSKEIQGFKANHNYSY